MLSPQEITEYEREARLECIRKTGRRPIKVTVTEVDSDDVEVTMELSPSSIARTRRITGYLSETSNWNKAKKSELKDRTLHQSVGEKSLPKAV